MKEMHTANEGINGSENAAIVRHFDLNIDKILDNWEVSHAIRELIANAIDESLLTKTTSPTVGRNESGWWTVRDFGRGLRYQDLIQSENPEKLSNPSVIGKFGIGLKDALATFDRKGIKVTIRSRHGDIGLGRVTKHLFDDLVTLHAVVSAPSTPSLIGTECCLFGVSDKDIQAAKEMFLYFSNSPAIEDTKYGSVHRRTHTGGVIYINGMKIADEPNFLFSYNITSLNAAIKKSLNRERQNLGRTAYSDRVRAILLSCTTCGVAQALADDLQVYSHGKAHDELAWVDVQQHAVRTLSATKRVLFVNSEEIVARPDVIESAQSTGYTIVAIPTTLSDKIRGCSDVQGAPVTEMHEFVKQHNASFQYSWVAPESLTASERCVWSQTTRILTFVDGLPANVRDIRISEIMCTNSYESAETNGLWDESTGLIIIKRSRLRTLATFAGTLLHEVLHAKFGITDVTREFESFLTELVGQLVSRLLDSPQHA